MNYLRLLSRTLGSRPEQLVLYATARCNARCKTCFYWEKLNQAQNELSLDEIRLVVSRLWNFHFLHITGGEPFLRRDLPEICEAFHPRVQVIHVFTNALLPQRVERHTREILRRCPGLRLKVSLSLDGIGAIHDDIRGVDRNFERFLQTFDRLVKLRETAPDLKINILSTLASFNEDSFRDTIDYVAQNLDADSFGINLTRGKPRDPAAALASPASYRELVRHWNFTWKPQASGRTLYDRFLAAVKKRMHDIVLQTAEQQREILPCVSAGRHVVVIGESGEVFPCELRGVNIGNLRDADYDLSRILKSKALRNELKEIKRIKCFCTHECFVQNSIVHSPTLYPGLLMEALAGSRSKPARSGLNHETSG